MNQLTNTSIPLPQLNEGETYVGLIGDAEGKLHHVILLPGDNDGATWTAALAWAKSIGGDLPNRVEQALLFANARDQFKRDWYWSSEKSSSGWAWFQYFGYGGQTSYGQGLKMRARAVRRLVIQ